MDATDVKNHSSKIPASIQWSLDNIESDPDDPEENKPIAIKLTLLALQKKGDSGYHFIFHSPL